MTNEELLRMVRKCFWDSMRDFISIAYRPPGRDKLKDSDTWQGFNAVLEDGDCEKKFFTERKKQGLKIIWFVRCYDCEEDNDVEVILRDDNPGKPDGCPKCGGKNIDIVLKGVLESKGNN